MCTIFDSLMSDFTINANLPSPIRGIPVGNEFKAIEYAKKLRENGFAVTTAMYPTVGRKKSILRVALSALHTKEEILSFCNSAKAIKLSRRFA